MSSSEYEQLLNHLGYILTGSGGTALVGERLRARRKDDANHLVVIDVVDLVAQPHLEPLCKNIEHAQSIPVRAEIAPLYDGIFVRDELFMAVTTVPADARSFSRLESLSSFWSYAARLVQALRFLHRREIVHGALSPDSIFDTGEGPLLSGFWWMHTADGIPQGPFTTEEVTMLIPNAVLPYQAPEQLEGESPSRESDIYSLGALLYYAVSGQAPRSQRRKEFTVANRKDLLRTPILPVQEWVPEVDNDIALFIEKLLLNDAANRINIFTLEAITLDRIGELPAEDDDEDDLIDLDEELVLPPQQEQRTEEQRDKRTEDQRTEIKEPRLVRKFQ